MITTDLSIARDHLQRGELIGLPTETVYGLAGNALDPAAIQQIYTLKNRPATNPLIVHVGSIEQAKTLVRSFPPVLEALAQAFWPGPLTLLLDRSDRIPSTVTAGSSKVAIRMPDHPLTLELLNQLDFPLVAPSANPYTRISPTRAEQVAAYFGDRLPVILQGGSCERGMESTIVGLAQENVTVYRLGSLPIEALEKIAGPITLQNQADQPTLAPGMAKKHYSPLTPLLLHPDPQNYQQENPHLRIGIFLTGQENPEEITPIFYQRLQEMDQAGYELLIANYFPEKGLGRTLNDRLRRASRSR